MRKLSLDAEDLRVETFAPDAEPAPERGTVVGVERFATRRLTCNFTGCGTCAVSCYDTCVELC